jgi:hypothetical protein
MEIGKMAKKLTKEITDTGVSIEFANGETLALQFADLSEDIKFRLMAHGASQKLGDASAGTERLIAGDWKSVRESSGSPKIGLLVEALARLTSRDIAECREVVESLDDETKKKLRAQPQLKAVMADIRAEREKAKAQEAGVGGVDFGALFG